MEEKNIWAESLITEAENLRERCKGFASADIRIYNEKHAELYKGAEKDFSQFLNAFNRFKKEYDIEKIYVRDIEKLENPTKVQPKINSNIMKIVSRLEKSISVLEGAKEISFEEEDEKKLIEIEDEINNLRPEMAVISDDLEKSLNEVRQGHFLSSAMITGRVIDHILEEIKKEENLGGPKEVIEFIQEDGIVEEADGQIVEAIKKYRNIYAHEVGKTPDFKNCSILLFGTIDLLQKLEDEGLEEHYNLR